MSKTETAKRAASLALTARKDVHLDSLEFLEVWHAYILGNEKWLFAVSIDGDLTEDYIEVTYNKQKNEYYADHYIKQYNYLFKNGV